MEGVGDKNWKGRAKQEKKKEAIQSAAIGEA